MSNYSHREISEKHEVAVLRVRNITLSSLEIHNVNVTCSCLAPDFSLPIKLGPGEETLLRFRIEESSDSPQKVSFLCSPDVQSVECLVPSAPEPMEASLPPPSGVFDV
ncbi:hypothetical protein [Roseiconus lacunae]|uniref:DUF1573 domain-containing protein n=1 Tax=Roseiconus lacunae TaxID=2605694 RepID=A0ABT7PEP5_9BACT|nr:hypothetical protein [Roseiconus lacunae]MDM4014764.1 hypothetical protein [Roseiconus lacunae]